MEFFFGQGVENLRLKTDECLLYFKKMDRISHTIANRTPAAVVCWVETPFVVLATGQSWTFGFSKLELMGEPIENLQDPFRTCLWFNMPS